METARKLADLIAAQAQVAGHGAYPRIDVDVSGWQMAIGQLENRNWTLLGLWGEPDQVNMALLEETSSEVAVFTLHCPLGRFPSVASRHPPAGRLERTVADLYGLDAENAPDSRSWLDHGRWGVRHPLGTASGEMTPLSYNFLTAEGEGLHQIAVGPVHAGIIEPGHFRFHANGETIVRLEARLGYAHKGVEALMQGASIDRAAMLAGRVSGDSTVAYATAFACAVEAAVSSHAPARAQWLRALMAELERLANHFGDIGAICNDASFALMHAHCAVLREHVLRASELCFGHRLMRDCVVPGGVSADIDAAKTGVLRGLWSRLVAAFRHSSIFMTTRPRFRTERCRRESSSRNWPFNLEPAASLDGRLAEALTRERSFATRLTINCRLMFRFSPRAT